MATQSNREHDFVSGAGQGVNAAESATWIHKLNHTFPALASPEYKMYFCGQFISLTGTWMQAVAQGWLVLTLTDSAFMLGLIAALGTLPSLFFTLFGGVLVDQFPKKTILILTQFCSMIVAFGLGIQTLFGQTELWHIGLAAFLLGLVNAVDAPARQAFVSEVVSREQLPSAIALNSGIFNLARVLGPGIAGVLITLTGAGTAIVINGASYLAVLVALWTIKTKQPFVKKKLETFKAIREGIAYVVSHPVIRTLILFTGISSVFGWSYTTLLPLIAVQTFHLGASGLGYFYGASGLGSLLATFVIAAFSRKISPIAFILGGSSLFAISIALFTFSTCLYTAMSLLFLAGFGLLSQFATMNTLIQSLVKSELRGRVVSIYIVMFIGLMPVGNFEIGILAEHFGAGTAIRVGAVIVFLFGLILFSFRNRIRNTYEIYKGKSTS